MASAQASYDKLVNGPTASDLQSYNNSIQSAQTSVQNALQGIATGLQSAYITNSNSVYLSTDSFFDNPLVNATLQITDVYFNDQQRQSQVDNQRRSVIESILNTSKRRDRCFDQRRPGLTYQRRYHKTYDH